MYRIGVISDTHGLLRPEVKEILRGCEAILHGGDIDRADILEELGEIAPTYAERNGGYTRIIRTGVRRGDAAETAVIELV